MAGGNSRAGSVLRLLLKLLQEQWLYQQVLQVQVQVQVQSYLASLSLQEQ